LIAKAKLGIIRSFAVPFAIVHAARAFLRTRRLAARLRTRVDVERWQAARLADFLSRRIGRVPFYAGMGAHALADLPVMDKATLMAGFARFNTAGATFSAVRAALDAGEGRLGRLIVGQSTGTSGNRGVFVISEAERFVWLGVILAKALPDAFRVRHRVALALPGFSRLYAAASDSGRVAVRFFDLARGVERWRDELIAYAPDAIVAPPKVLRALAEAGGLAPKHIFSAAEVLDPLDRAVIEAGLGATVREIYMATEGLFGVACPHGTLHLAEDVVAFEWEPVEGASDLVAPLITDFTRHTQIMARYRMNDLLRLADAPCGCGSPLRAVARIEGRRDDVFLLPGCSGGATPVMVTPDVMRNAVVDSDRRITDFRIVQTGANQIALVLPTGLAGDAAEAARAALRATLTKAGVGAATIALEPIAATPDHLKLRRVRRDWRPDG